MTLVGTYNGATVLDDYAHHPTEIRATLRALRQRYTPNASCASFNPISTLVPAFFWRTRHRF